MASTCLYLHIHQPYRVKRYHPFSMGEDADYFNHEGEDDLDNARIIRKVARKSYLPMTELLLTLLTRHPEFRVSFSVTGTALEQLLAHAPEVIERLQALAKTGRVEFLGETYHHSLAFFYSRPEFERQVKRHRIILKNLFGVTPRVFRNTELAYTNELGAWADEAGYDGILAEGWEPVIGWRSPNFVYRPKGAQRTKLLLKNYKLSDDIAFRFSSRDWAEWPLTAEKFAQWVGAVNGSGETVNLFMDFETYGEHQWEETGIFRFLETLVPELLKHPDNDFKTPSEVIAAYPARDEIDVPQILTWADTDRDLTAWTGNAMQRSALAALYELEPAAAAAPRDLSEAWRRLQTSDHFYYMCTKWFADGDVHAYFSPYRTPHEAHTAFMNALGDLRLRLEEAQPVS
jgi:alpha-amylase